MPAPMKFQRQKPTHRVQYFLDENSAITMEVYGLPNVLSLIEALLQKDAKQKYTVWTIDKDDDGQLFMDAEVV